MPVSVDMTVKGRDLTRRRLRRAREGSRQALRDEMLTAAVIVEAEAKRLAPVRTGRLRASIKHEGPLDEGKNVVVRVGTDVKYSSFVEFGTGRRGAASKLSELAPEARAREGYAYGRVKGMSARPFLLPALERWRDHIVKSVGERIRVLVNP